MKKWLSKQHTALLVIYCILVAMVSYTCMYGIRIPYKAAKFEGLFLWGVHYKVVLVIAQVAGYMLSKFIGIKIISELKKEKRIFYIIVFNLAGLLALLLFALTPYPYNFIWMFFNGLPLGLMFGLVFSYLEGRRFTEFLSLGLAISIIVASGYVKTIGKYMLLTGVSEMWMPFTTGSIFFVILLISTWFISKIPGPTQQDIESRTERININRKQRREIIQQFFPGIAALIIVYTLLTMARDYRDTFMVEIWAENGIHNASILTRTELPVALVVLLFIGFISFIKKNSTAFYLTITIVSIGTLVLISSSLLFKAHVIDTFSWTILTGLGIFLGYIVFNTVIFERMIALFKIKGNFGFLMYLADSIGYLGSIAVLLFKEFGNINMQHTSFLLNISLFAGIVCAALTVLALFYFYRKKNPAPKPVLEIPE
jgi:hypothetical protein